MLPLSFYILAGGQNSRMGKDKGLLPFDNKKTFIEKIIEEIKPLNLPLTIISENNAYQQYGHTIPDITPKIGPMGGIYTALANAKTDYVFMLTCDSPFITTEMLHTFLNQCDFSSETQAFVTKSNGRIYPITAIYHKSVLPVLDELIAEKNYRVRDVLQNVKFQEIEIPEAFILNINNEYEYKKHIQL